MPEKHAAKPCMTRATSFCCLLCTVTILSQLLSQLSLLLGSPACAQPVYMNLNTEQKLVYMNLNTVQKLVLHLTLVKSSFIPHQHFPTVLVVLTCFSKCCVLGAAEVQI